MSLFCDFVIKSQCSIVIFAKIAKNWPNFSFLAKILVADQKNPNFLDFLDPYTCPDLGQEESQKVWSTLVITLVATLMPSVLSIMEVTDRLCACQIFSMQVATMVISLIEFSDKTL